jgi:hypothetical protein
MGVVGLFIPSVMNIEAGRPQTASQVPLGDTMEPQKLQ